MGVRDDTEVEWKPITNIRHSPETGAVVREDVVVDRGKATGSIHVERFW